jgi:ketosteroid isomerase-like protein
MKTFILGLFFLTNAFAEDLTKMTNSEKVTWSFNALNKHTVSEVVDEFYAENIEFSDPVEKITGREGIKKYYTNMYQNVKEIRFNFSEMVSQGDTVVGVWVMTLKTDSLNAGEPFQVEGNSVIRFKDGKAIYHRDYFDMGAFIYEKIPVLGWMVRKVKSKLQLESVDK